MRDWCRTWAVNHSYCYWYLVSFSPGLLCFCASFSFSCVFCARQGLHRGLVLFEPHLHFLRRFLHLQSNQKKKVSLEQQNLCKEPRTSKFSGLETTLTLILRRSLLASEFADSTLMGVSGWESKWLKSVGMDGNRSMRSERKTQQCLGF